MTTPSIRPYLEIRTAGPLGFSGDGARLLVSSNIPGTHQLYRLDVATGEMVQVTDEAEPVTGAYVPGGRRLLVARDDGGNERHQLFLADDDGSDLEPLVHDPRWIHTPGGISRDGRLAAYRSNARNGVDFDVYVVDLTTRERRCVFTPGGWAQPAGFSPDGRWLAVLRMTERNMDNDLYLVDVTADASADAVRGDVVVHVAAHDDDAQVGAPAWITDAGSFWFSTDTGRDRSAIARFDLDARTWEYVLEDDDADLQVIGDPSGRTAVVVRSSDGFSTITVRDGATLEHRADVPLPHPGVVAGVTVADGGGAVAFQLMSARIPGDTFLFDVDTAELRRLTESPCDVDPASLVEPVLERFASFDGESVPVFLYLPPQPVQTPPPVVVVIHGGPEGQSQPGFNPVVQYLAARGYAVAVPNVRGSVGYGKRYHHLDDVRKRLDSVADLGALHDWLLARDDVDGTRAALYGGSYGGYMVLAGLAFQPERWAAGVDVVGISSLVTFLENTSAWRRAFREREYGSLEHDRDFLHDVSPLTHVDAMRAPLLIIHGANDPRVPLSEAEQLHRTLADKGVTTELLVYADEGHGLAKLANRLDAYPKVAAFLDRVLA